MRIRRRWYWECRWVRAAASTMKLHRDKWGLEQAHVSMWGALFLFACFLISGTLQVCDIPFAVFKATHVLTVPSGVTWKHLFFPLPVVKSLALASPDEFSSALDPTASVWLGILIFNTTAWNHIYCFLLQRGIRNGEVECFKIVFFFPETKDYIFEMPASSHWDSRKRPELMPLPPENRAEAALRCDHWNRLKVNVHNYLPPVVNVPWNLPAPLSPGLYVWYSDFRDKCLADTTSLKHLWIAHVPLSFPSGCWDKEERKPQKAVISQPCRGINFSLEPRKGAITIFSLKINILRNKETESGREKGLPRVTQPLG